MKIAILLPLKPDLSCIRRARALSIALIADTVQRRPRPVQVAVGLPFGDPVWQAHARMISAGLHHVVVRALSWESIEARQAARMFPLLRTVEDIDQVAIPRDWGWNFADCDLWIVFGDAAVGAFAHLKPTAVYCRDLAARYVPETYAPDMRSPLWDRQIEAFRAWRHSECVFATDPATLDDVVGYAGVERSRTRLLPPIWALYETVPAASVRTDLRDAILWLAEAAPDHDSETIVEVLRRYVRRDNPLRVVIAGERVAALDPRRGEPNSVSLTLANAPELLARTSFETISALGDLDSLVAGAAIVVSSSVTEGEPDHVPLAARYARPLVASDYPQLRRATALLGGATYLYKPGDVNGALAALLQADTMRAQDQGLGAPTWAGFPPGNTRDDVVAGYSDLIDALLTHVPA